MSMGPRHALVLGLGRSGWAAFRLLKSLGVNVTGVDAAQREDLHAAAERFASESSRVVLGAERLPDTPCDLCVVSPGIPAASPWVSEMTRRGVPVMSELELGWRQLPSRTLAVTGSNGKSTMVKWLSETLRASGLTAVPAGNYGMPASEVALQAQAPDWVVLEVSSFQLETVRDFRADVGLLLNCFPNHLDRHADYNEYLGLKSRLFRSARPGDACIVSQELLERVRSLSGGQGHWLSFGEGGDYRYREGRVWRGQDRIADLRGTYFGNDILGLNAAGGLAACEAAGIAAEWAVQSAREFTELPHRMQKVGIYRGVSYVNDSKATNLAALAAALRACPGKARLIAGGLAKEKDFAAVKEVLVLKAASVYLMGASQDGMLSAWREAVRCVACGDLEKALSCAAEEAQPGETVVLAPGCASFDQFKNFEERGNIFVRLVRERFNEEERECAASFVEQTIDQLGREKKK